MDPALVPIVAGTFRMGTSLEDEERLVGRKAKVRDNEKPPRAVKLSAYEIGL